MAWEKRKIIGFFGVIVLALALRLIAINQSFWLDEAIGANYAQSYSYSELVTKFPLADFHPPLFYVALKVWGSLVGFNDIVLRLFPVIAGVATVAILYLISPLAAVLLAVSQFGVYYSQELRMYPFTALFAVSAVYFYQNLVKNRMKSYNWIGFSTSIAILGFLDYLPIVLFPVFVIYAVLVKKDRRWLIQLIACFVPYAILFLLWLPIFSRQLTSGGWLANTLPGWADVVGGANLKQAVLVWTKFVGGRVSLVPKAVYLLWLVVSSATVIPAIVFYLRGIRNKLTWLTLLWLVFPLVVIFLLSLVIPAFNYFRFVFILPAFYLIVSQGFETMTSKLKVYSIVAYITVALVGCGIYYSNTYLQRENWKAAVTFVESAANKHELVVFANTEPFAPYLWYKQTDLVALGALPNLVAEANTPSVIADLTRGYRGAYVFRYLSDLTDKDRLIQRGLEAQGFTESDQIDFAGVGIVEHWLRL